MKVLSSLLFLLLVFTHCSSSKTNTAINPEIRTDKIDASTDFEKVIKTEAEWRAQLTKEAYYVTREKGTERAFTGPYWDSKQEGTYNCVCCALPLFSSETKFNSGTGWPSFYAAIDEKNVGEISDTSYGMTRVEIICNRCDAHLGHVFPDGPKPSGLRYCVNGHALNLVQ